MLSACGGGGNDKPHDAGGDGMDASTVDTSDSGPDVADAGSACVPVADHIFTDPAASGDLPALAWTGDGYGVVWHDGRTGDSLLFFAQLDRDGVKIGSDRPIAGTSGAEYPAIAWNGQVFGISFVTSSTTPTKAHFARVAADGTLQGTVAEAGEAGTAIPSIVWDGQTFALAYHSARGAARLEIFMSRFDTAGARVGAEVQVTNNGTDAFNPSIAWTGSRYGISFQDSRAGASEVFLALVDANGAKIGQETRLSTSNGAGTSYIAASSTGFAVTYAGLQGPTLVRLDTDGSRARAETPIRNTPAPIVWNGAQYGFASSGTAGGKVYLSTIDESAAAASTPVPVSDADHSGGGAVALAWNGSGYGVAWVNAFDGMAALRFAVVCP